MNLIIIFIVAVLNITILLFVFTSKRKDSFLFNQTPEEENKDVIKAFDCNLKTINAIEVSNYKLGSDHIY